jgi:hypothetical protein
MPARGVWEALGPILVLAILAAAPVAALGFRGGFGDMPSGDVASLAGLNFLVIQGGAVHYTLPAERGMLAVNGTFSLTPLVGALLLLRMAYSSGRRLFSVARTRLGFVLGVLAFLATVVVVNVAVAFFSTPAFAGADMAPTVVNPLSWSAAGLILGGIVGAGGILPFIRRDRWVQAKGQWWRWGVDYVRAMMKAVWVLALSLIVASALALGVAMGVHWAPMMTAFDGVSSSLSGTVAMALMQIGYLPNLMAWALSWLSGAGFAFGIHTVASPLGTTMGALPPFPPLAAIPMAVPDWAIAALAVPAVCGGVAAWWFLREGEDHLGEWLQLRLGPGMGASFLGMLVNSLILGVGGGLFGALAAWISAGSLGIGRFTQIGADPLQVLWMLGLETFIGALLGFLVVPWLEGD